MKKENGKKTKSIISIKKENCCKVDRQPAERNENF